MLVMLVRMENLLSYLYKELTVHVQKEKRFKIDGGDIIFTAPSRDGRNLLNNTIIVITSDNGMPFPRVKGQVFPFDNRLPLAIRWGKGIKNPGRIINDYVSFSDFAPTFLDLAGIDSENNKMEDFSGISWKSIFKDKKNIKLQFCL